MDDKRPAFASACQSPHPRTEREWLDRQSILLIIIKDKNKLKRLKRRSIFYPGAVYWMALLFVVNHIGSIYFMDGYNGYRSLLSRVVVRYFIFGSDIFILVNFIYQKVINRCWRGVARPPLSCECT